MTDQEKFMTGLIKTNYEYVRKEDFIEVYINKYNNFYYYLYNTFIIKFSNKDQIIIRTNIRKEKIEKLLK